MKPVSSPFATTWPFLFHVNQVCAPLITQKAAIVKKNCISQKYVFIQGPPVHLSKGLLAIGKEL